MAIYKYPNFLQQSAHAAYDQVHKAADIAPYSGIYRCEGCGENAVSTHGNPLPPQNHHQHTANQGAIRWRLIVSTH